MKARDLETAARYARQAGSATVRLEAVLPDWVDATDTLLGADVTAHHREVTRLLIAQARACLAQVEHYAGLTPDAPPTTDMLDSPREAGRG